MGRRADHTHEELKEMAIKAGLKLIHQEGFSNFSARKVATNIGYSIGTLYNVFGGYDDLILHINARTLDEWFEVMQAAIVSDKTKKPIHALAKAYIEYSRTHHPQWISLFEHHIDGNKNVPEWYMPKMTRFFILVEKPLLLMLGNNTRKAKRASRVLWAGIHGICVLSHSNKLDLVDSDSPEVLANSFIDNYLAGLMAKKAGAK